ncbi:hypothetical protein D3C81_469530 [compost metagenome]
MAGVLVVERIISTDDQLASTCDCGLRLLIAVQHGIACTRLPVALEGGGFDPALQLRRLGGHHHAAGIAADHITILQPLVRADHRVVVVLGVAPTRMHVLETTVKTGVQQIAGRARGAVQLAIGTLEVGLLDIAGLHVERAAGQVDVRARLGNHAATVELHRATLRRPFADAMAGDAQVTAHFQQATGRIPTIGFIAICAGRHQYQITSIQPDVLAVERFVITVERCIALFVALHIDLDVVRFHRDLDANVAGYINACAAFNFGISGIDKNLATGRQGQAAFLEAHVTATDDLHQRLITPVQDAVTSLVRFLHQGLALDIQRGGGAVVQHHRGGAALAQRNFAIGVTAGSLQMHGATGVHGRGRDQRAVLAHVMAGQGDIAGRCLDQARVADDTGGGSRINPICNWLAQRGDHVAARRRCLVLLGAHALADHEGVTSRQHRLPVGRADLAVVVHLPTEQQHIAPAFRHRGRHVGSELRAALDDHIAGCRRMVERTCGSGQVIGEGGNELIALRITVDALAELRIADVDCGCGQVLYIDLAAAVEHHAIAVDQHHRAFALDAPQDLRGTTTGVVDAVEQRPARLLVEIHDGIATDVEGLPVEDRLVSGLLDVDRGDAILAALGCSIGVVPTTGQCIVIDLQSAFAEAVRHLAWPCTCRIARGLLQALLHGDRLRGGIEVLKRCFQRIARLLCLLVAALQVRRHAIGKPAGLRCGLLLRALAGKPGGTESLLCTDASADAASHQQHRDCL